MISSSHQQQPTGDIGTRFPIDPFQRYIHAASLSVFSIYRRRQSTTAVTVVRCDAARVSTCISNPLEMKIKYSMTRSSPRIEIWMTLNVHLLSSCVAMSSYLRAYNRQCSGQLSPTDLTLVRRARWLTDSSLAPTTTSLYSGNFQLHLLRDWCLILLPHSYSYSSSSPFLLKLNDKSACYGRRWTRPRYLRITEGTLDIYMAHVWSPLLPALPIKGI